MSKKEQSKDTLIIVKSMEESGWPELGTDFIDHPPLGTINRDGDKTPEEGKTTPCFQDPTFMKTKPWRPGFEVLLGHSSVSFKEEPEKVDSQDISRPKDYVRGHDTYTASLEFDQLAGNYRIQGLTDGAWDPDKAMYQPGKRYRPFIMYTLKDPDRFSLEATQCKMLVKHFGVIFDNIETTMENPVRLAVPVSRRLYRRFPNFEFPTSPQTILDKSAGAGPGTYVPDEQPREFTRLNIAIIDHSASGQLVIKGQNLFKEEVEFVLDVDSNGGFLCPVLFDVIDEVTVNVAIGGTIDFKIYDYDWGLKNPELLDS